MPSAKLCKRVVDAAEPRERLYILYDQELKGFGLRVMPSGFKSWVIEYRPPGAGRDAAKKRLAIGSASALTAYEARAIAKDMLAGIRGGKDPLASRSAERGAIALGDLAKQFLIDHIEQKRKPKTVQLYRLAINRHIIPTLGSTKAARITRADALRLHSSLRSTPVLANRVLAVLGSLYAWAGKTGHVPDGASTRLSGSREIANKGGSGI